MNQIKLPSVLLLLLLPALAAAEPPKKLASVEGLTEYQFDNGLRALLFPDNSRSKVTVNMTVLVGSRHEGYGETGMAHLLEHMVFKGTPNHPNIPKALQDHGAQFNGSTSADRTNYYETMGDDDENLEFGIGLEADRLVNSYVKREDLDSEMTVVRNEFERGENSPLAVLGKRISAAAYDWHNYGKSTIGNRSDIERVPIENLRAFYRRFYQPDNVVLVVAGRFDEAKALGLIQKHFGAIPRPERKLTATYTEEPAQDGERLVTLRRVGDVAAVGVAYHIPAGPHEDTAALQVLANILTTQPSGRLFKALVESKKAVSVSAYASSEHDPGLMSVDAEVARDGSLEAVRDELIATLEGLGAGGVTEVEVNRAKRQILKARELAAGDTSQIAISLSEWAAQGDWRLYFLHRDQIEQVTVTGVQSAAARYLQRNNRTVGLFIPTAAPDRTSVPATPNLETLVGGYQGRAALAEGESFDASPTNIEARVQRLDLGPGIKATFLPKKTRGEEVHLLLTLRYGDENNLKGYESATGLLPELMLRGTKQLDYQQLRDELDRLKASLTSGAGGGGGRRGRGGGGGSGALGSVTFSIQAKHDTLPAVISLLGQVIREPALPVDQFEILKRERLASLENSRAEPSALAPRLLQREFAPYAKEDIRYVPTIDEAIARLRVLNYEQVAKLYHDYLGAQAGELTVIGDFDSQACLPILRQALDGWTSAQPYARITAPLTSEAAGVERQIKTPDKANATYAAGLLFALRDDDPDYPALVIGNYIFGGGSLSSRLATRVRQKEGLSYSVGASFSASPFDQRASLTISAICNPQNIGRLEKAVQEELDRLLREGVTAEELDQAKEGYLRTQKVARSSETTLAGLLSNFRHLDRSVTYQAELERRIQALTPAQVQTALKRHIDPKKLVIVTAGDFNAKAPGN